MTVHQSRRVVRALVTLVVTTISIGAPIPLAASPLQQPIAKHVTHPDARFDGMRRTIAPRSPAAQFGNYGDDPFASLHFE
jgi:hypothetical protein